MKENERGGESMRRVVDALLEGKPAPAEAQAALTEAERAEVASIARTAHLASVTLRRPDPPPAVEAAALTRAETALASRVKTGTFAPASGAASAAASGSGATRPAWRVLWDRMTGDKSNQSRRDD